MDTNQLSLTIHRGKENEPRRISFDSERVTVGRSDQCDIRLPYRVVSSHHLTFERRGDGYAVRDESSTNGTKFDGTMLEAGEWQNVEDGSRIQIVDVFIDIELSNTTRDNTLGDFTLEQTGTLARELLGEALEEEGEELAYFEIVEGADTDSRYEIPDEADDLDIGGAESCAITLPGSDLPDRAVVVNFQGDAFQLTPVDQSQVRLEDRKIDEPVVLRDGARLTIADLVLVFHDPLQAELEELAELDRLEGGAVADGMSSGLHTEAGDGGGDATLSDEAESEDGAVRKKTPGETPGADETRRRRWLDVVLLLATTLAILAAIVVMLVTFGLV